MPKRVLIVAYYFPPLATSGAMRPLAFVRHLDRARWTPQVLTVAPENRPAEVGLDPALEARIPSDIQVLRVGHGDRRGTIVKALHRWRKGAEPTPRQWGSSPRVSFRGTLRQGASTALEQLFAFPDRSAPWLRTAPSAAAAAFRDAPPEVVVATAPPWTSLFVGSRLARHFGVPLVLDFRDPWTANASRATNAIDRWRARRSETTIVDRASLIITNTEASATAFRRLYPRVSGRVICITNGFDTSHFPFDVAANSTTSPALQLCHFGTVYGQRTPTNLLHALKHLADRGTLPGSHARPFVRFIGGWEHTDAMTEGLVADLELRGVVRREPAVPHDVCLSMMREASVLLILQPSSALQIPGKLYEYISVRRPLLIVGGEGATASLVKKHSLGYCSPDRFETIVETLQTLADGRLPLAEPRPEAICQFDYRLLTMRLAGALDDVVFAR